MRNGDLKSKTKSMEWTEQGAGGVGGLLIMNDVQNGTHFYGYDGNGNVALMVNCDNGKESANYEYGPFGEVIKQTGLMSKINPFRFSTKRTVDSIDVILYEYRPYSPIIGRWLSRDPIDTQNGANIYSFVGNNSLNSFDVLGLWGSDVHNDMTLQWANQLKINSTYSQMIGESDNKIDEDYNSATHFDNFNWGWHFNRSRNGDSRLMHRDAELAKAKAQCTKTTDNPDRAATYLGRALHPLQDWVAHGDFNRIEETPSLQLSGLTLSEILCYIHNYYVVVTLKDIAARVDNPRKDAFGPNGRPTIDTMQFGVLLPNGDKIYWVKFITGHQRIDLTERLTKDLLREFQGYIKSNAKPCGKCWKAFLENN